MEGIGEDTPQIFHRLFSRVNRESRAAAEVTKATAIVQSHDMVGMGMSEKDRVEPADVFAQHLQTELWCRVNHQLDLFGRDINRGAGPVIFRIGQESGRVFLANERDPLRCAGAEEDERKSHRCTEVNQLPLSGQAEGAKAGPNVSIFLLLRWAGTVKFRSEDMLVTLRIKNLALVTDLAIDFQPGYNVVTGETGAGKSILIGA